MSVCGFDIVCDMEEREEHRHVRRVLTGVGALWGTALAIVAAAGIPLGWIWLASKLAGTKRDLTPSLAIFIATGILVSYWLALLLGAWGRGRSVDRAGGGGRGEGRPGDRPLS